MVHQQRKGDEEKHPLLVFPHHSQHQQHKPKLHLFLLLFSFASTFLVLSLLCCSSSSPLAPFSYLYGGDIEESFRLPCSDTAENTMCCDRKSSERTDVCVMKGDIRTRSSTSSVHLYGSVGKEVVRKIRPYTRKWEKSVMDTIDELRLVSKITNADDARHRCDVQHNVPAIVFSTGGYTGNVYHEFNDGIIPLYITSQHYNKQVVFVMLEYHDWWVSKYSDILRQLSDFEPIDFSKDNRTHCFSELTAGLRIHDELTIDPAQVVTNNSMIDFRRLLEDAYRPRVEYIEKLEKEAEATNKTIEEPLEPSTMEKPTLVILSRNGSRGLDNENELVSLCDEIGFNVRVLRPEPTTELAKIYRELNNSDVMIGVHGAAMTHLLFMRPATTFIQIVPLGTEWAAEAYYGGPAKKMGLKYVEYRILPKESSLYNLYDSNDPILRDPTSVTSKGWKVTKEIYLDGQSVKLDLNRFLKRLTRVYEHAVTKKNKMDENWKHWDWQQPPVQERPEVARGRKVL